MTKDNKKSEPSCKSEHDYLNELFVHNQSKWHKKQLEEYGQDSEELQLEDILLKISSHSEEKG